MCFSYSSGMNNAGDTGRRSTSVFVRRFSLVFTHMSGWKRIQEWEFEVYGLWLSEQFSNFLCIVGSRTCFRDERWSICFADFSSFPLTTIVVRSWGVLRIHIDQAVPVFILECQILRSTCQFFSAAEPPQRQGSSRSGFIHRALHCWLLFPSTAMCALATAAYVTTACPKFRAVSRRVGMLHGLLIFVMKRKINHYQWQE